MASAEPMKDPLLPEKQEKQEKISIATGFAMGLYVLSGCSQPLLMSAVNLAGAGDTTCQLYMIPYCAGAAAIGVLGYCSRCEKPWYSFALRRILAIAVVDLSSQILNFSGNMYAGSGIFAVIYASVTIWVALLSRIVLKRFLTGFQWLAIMCVFVGLALTAIEADFGGSQVLYGAGLILVGTALHSLMYVASEYIMVRGSYAVPCIPWHVTGSVTGVAETTVMCLWQVAYSRQHWEEKVALPIEAASSWSTIALLFALTALANFLHGATFLFLLTRIGAVSAAVGKGLQAVLTFVFSHILFCSWLPSECFTPLKGVSLVVVVLGVWGYVAATRSLDESA